MSQPKRSRGRPKGSRNKKNNLSTATVRQICEYHKFNPAEKLIRIANNDDWTDDGVRIDWPMPLQARAAEKLFDSIHGNKSLPGGGVDASEGGQYEIVFIEGDSGFQLPGEGSAESAAGVLRPEPVQRVGMSSQDGEDSLCYQSEDTQSIDLSAT